MTTGFYLIDNPPARSQGRHPRRAKPTGCIVLHTAENITDTIGADTGAEAVARFIQRRQTAGNYHTIGDRDSTIRMYPYDWEVWQDGTGSNAWAIGISLAMRSADWLKLPKPDADAYLETMVTMAVDAAQWLQTEHDITVPAWRLTRGQSNQGRPGFIAHGDRDPARRTDPGRNFPWTRFLSMYEQRMKGSEPMTPEQIAHVKAIQTALNQSGIVDPPLDVDGIPGPLTVAAARLVSGQTLTPELAELARIGEAFTSAVDLVTGD